MPKVPKAIYQPWSEEEFSADVDVQSMSPIQRWMYRTLCQKAFVCTTRPFPPNDDAILWKLAGCPSIAFWNQHKEPVRGMFVPRTIDGVQVLFRQRLADDWSKLQAIREAKKRGAEAMWDGKRMHVQSTADGVHSTAVQVSKEVKVSKEVEPKAIAQKPRSELPGFAVFWEAYPKKVGKPSAIRAWLSKVRDDSRWPEVVGGLESWKQSEQWQEVQFIPYPATFLIQMRWQDEVPKNGGTKNDKRISRTLEAAHRVMESGPEMGDGLGGSLSGGAFGAGNTNLLRLAEKRKF